MACLVITTVCSAQPAPFSVKITGTGRPMILIPGLLSSGDVWSTTVDRYKDRYECHVLTLAGFAGQPAIDAPPQPRLKRLGDAPRESMTRQTVRQRFVERRILLREACLTRICGKGECAYRGR